MDVRLDQTGAAEAPACIIGFRSTCQSSFDSDNLAVGNTDIDGLCRWPIRQSDIPYDQIHAI